MITEFVLVNVNVLPATGACAMHPAKNAGYAVSA
ncbi:hypothetical protein PsAD13_04654 [Pseudovibrio sp. Ad13]|nr:hypothetical protein PsAD13_04654 [Pseudovibrio sp. Ad13]KZK89661.1 hypothetical protein PsAD5_04947 [Pseudovibrio sp. Ad5]KZL14488.1 hypothetical protein PsAD37_04977 [Pseudovibrio sp. Ad37]KZL25392.1 hypothetical protein PsWM33_02258 [Pseudovibrio sp. WM33]